MKKVLLFSTSVLLIATGIIISSRVHNTKEPVSATNKTLQIYNYGSYIDPELLTKFTKQTGYKITYETYDSNESMQIKLEHGGSNYDLVFPSEPFVTKLAQEKLLAPLDYSKIHGFNNLDPLLLNKKFDPHNKYSIPYFWGTTGIMYNQKVFTKNDVDRWAKLWTPKIKHQLMLIDAPRESMGLGLQALGYSENDRNQQHIIAAKQKLAQLGPNVKAILNDEIRTYVASGEANVAVAYSGVADFAHTINPNINYVIPKDGGSVWTDNMSIPNNAKNKTAAYAFINFLLEPKNAAKNAEYVAYSSPNLAARKYLPKAIINDEILYPKRSELKHLEHYEVLPTVTVQAYNDQWLEAKMALTQGGK